MRVNWGCLFSKVVLVVNGIACLHAGPGSLHHSRTIRWIWGVSSRPKVLWVWWTAAPCGIWCISGMCMVLVPAFSDHRALWKGTMKICYADDCFALQLRIESRARHASKHAIIFTALVVSLQTSQWGVAMNRSWASCGAVNISPATMIGFLAFSSHNDNSAAISSVPHSSSILTRLTHKICPDVAKIYNFYNELGKQRELVSQHFSTLPT